MTGETSIAVLKLVGVAQDTASFVEAVKSGDPEKIIVESLRLAVSVTETDILVHVTLSDGEEIETTMFHPFYVQDAESESGIWRAASNLVSGDKLLMEDGQSVYVEEVRIEKLAENIKVYNLEIEGLHTYFVGEGVLVHNGCNLGENMKRRDGNPGQNYDAHHIFPQQYRKWFNLMGIDVDEADFGIWLEKHAHRKNSKSYNKLWGEFFSRYKFDTNIIKDLSLLDAIEYISEMGRAW